MSKFVLRGDYRRFITFLRSGRQLNDSTVKHYERWLARWAAYLHGLGKGPWEVTEDDISGFTGMLQSRRYSEETRIQATNQLRVFYRWGHRNDLIAKNPWEEIKGPRRPERLPRVLTQEQVRRLLQAAQRDRSPEGLRDYAILETLYATGCRVSELVGLDLADLQLDGDQPEILVYGKNSKERKIPLTDTAVKALGDYLRWSRPYFLRRSNRALLLNPRGTRLSRQGVVEAIDRAKRRAIIRAKGERQTCQERKSSPGSVSAYGTFGSART